MFLGSLLNHMQDLFILMVQSNISPGSVCLGGSMFLITLDFIIKKLLSFNYIDSLLFKIML